MLHSFTGTDNGDGSNPQASLVEGSDGALYGTTSEGGTNYAGTVFKLNKDGSGYTVLRSFTGSGGDGRYPDAGLTEGSDGVLYGTTVGGGSSLYYGTVFKLNKDGSGYMVLRSFTRNNGDGGYPNDLVESSDGALYGTTLQGGANDSGTVFKLNKDGSGYTVLRSFRRSGGDGSNPQAGLVEGSDGALYGTTLVGGITNAIFGYNGYGTVFKLNKNGSGYMVLRSFTGSGGDGWSPNGLIKGSDGALYGTTTDDGDMGLGTVFKLLLPPVIITQPRSQSVIEGEHVTFTVTATGTKPFSIQWQLKGIDLDSATNATLTFSHVRVADAGDYAVVVSNAVGAVASTTASLEVVTPAQAVDRLLQLVTSSELHRKNKQPLVVTLKAARASFERDKPRAGAKLLQAFQHKVRAQIGRFDPVTTEILIHAAQAIIDAVSSP